MIAHNSAGPPNPQFGAGPSSVHKDNGRQALPILELLNEINAAAIKLRQRVRLSDGIATGSSGAEHAVLEIVNRLGAATVPQIARERFTSRQNIQILVDRLAGEGRVEVTGNPAHKRSMLVHLTDQGRAWLREDEQSRKQIYEEIGALFSAAELSVLRSALGKLRATLGKENGQTQNGNQQRPSAAHLTLEKTKTGFAKGTPRAETVEEQFPVNLL